LHSAETERGRLMLGHLRDRLTPATRRSRIIAIAAVAAVIALVSAGLVLTSGGSGKQVTAYFTETIGVYPGSTVRILGVSVGTIDSVQPQGRLVKVTMTINDGVPVPANAGAVVVAASVVSDRFIQLTPPWTSGPQLASGAVIPASRTATPLEVDQLYASLTKLATDLGPNGANAHGALSNAINTGAANLAGSNGKDFNTMIRELGQATRTLSGSRGDFFATINNLQQFTTMLKTDDSQVRLAQQQLAQVSGFLASDRQDLAGALHELATALGQVQTFIAGNRTLIKSNVSKLAGLTKILVDERASLAQTVDVAPLAVDNVLNAYDPVHRSLDGRGDLRELEVSQQAAASSAPAASIPSASAPGSAPGSAPAAGSQAANPFCAAARSADGSVASPLGSLCRQEQAAGAALVPVTAQQQAGLPPLPLPAVGPVYGSGSAVPGKGR
jgi:phospholipid/cholesterol/gamma-HCH transport system substrate-binding protein